MSVGPCAACTPHVLILAVLWARASLVSCDACDPGALPPCDACDPRPGALPPCDACDPRALPPCDACDPGALPLVPCDACDSECPCDACDPKPSCAIGAKTASGRTAKPGMVFTLARKCVTMTGMPSCGQNLAIGAGRGKANPAASLLLVKFSPCMAQ